MTTKVLDPLAQSFFVDQPTMLTKVDLYFATKDNTLPIFLRIRRNQQGAPTSFIVPFSEVVIPAASINVSANGQTATTIAFESPVYLDIGEYSLTLSTDSKNYRVWISELGSADVFTDRQITEQPLLGSLFKSQNASTWSPIQSQDLKFTLYRAVFATNTTGIVTLKPANAYQHTYNYLTENDLEVYPNSPILKIYEYNHGLVENSYLRFTSFANANVAGNINTIFGIQGNVFEETVFTVSNVKSDSFTITLPTPVSNVTSITRFGKGTSYEKDVLYDAFTPTIADLSFSNTIAAHKILTTTPSTGAIYSLDSSFNIVTNKEENLFNSSRVLTGNTNTTLKIANNQSFQYMVELTTGSDRVSPIIDSKQLGGILKKNLINSATYDNTVFDHELSTVSIATSNVTALTSTVGLIHLTDTADQANAKGIVKGSYIEVTANINDGQYRVIDVLNNGANIKVSKISGTITTDNVGANIYTITNSPAFIAEEAATGSTAYSKYITKQVDLVNASTSIKFFLDIAKPANADVEFYYKTKLAGDNINLKDKEYTKIENVTIPISQSGEFYEVSKLVEGMVAFTSIVFKVVFKSTNSAQSPKVKNLRLIALE